MNPMMTPRMTACADMILTDAVEDLADREHISTVEARTRIIECGAYDCLYDPDCGLWMEGPDYFLCFVRQMENRKNNDGLRSIRNFV